MAGAGYGRVGRDIWESTTFRAISPEAKLVYLYLKTCRHGNLLGAFVCRPAHVSIDLQYSIERVSKLYSELESAELWPDGPGLIVYDDAPGVVFLTNELARDPLGGPKQIAGAVSIVRSLPFSERVFKVLSLLPDEVGGWAQPIAEVAQQRLSKHLAKGSDTVSLDYGTPKPKPKPEPKPKPSGSPAAGKGQDESKAALTRKHNKMFDELQAAYPTVFNRHNSGPIKARAAYRRDLAEAQKLGFESDEALHAHCLTQLEIAKGCRSWTKEGGQYTAGIMSWCTNRLWQNDWAGGQTGPLSDKASATARAAAELLDEQEGA